MVFVLKLLGGMLIEKKEYLRETGNEICSLPF